ncbi:class I SAM-dependent methyltransferase [Macromonas nakdongensis]|uniref:class I SAM-dependent methyltransferase n=1 Tax=Macromonas nakdongensis TaxID=1843082 RepID=UPI000C3425F7|nr:class I SAM-dependent methyltransferase [Macromonas nakdongensis]
MNIKRILKINPKVIALGLFYRLTPFKRHYCVICKRYSGGFLPYAHAGVSKLTDALECIGSNVEAFSCPWCGCHDRERHIFMYMTASGFLPDLTGKKILHFAPEKHLSRIIRASSPDEYIGCDLYPHSPDIIKVDMLSMPFKDSQFDLLIANHVLEHVFDADRAIKEITRVIKPGGHAIIQTPFCKKLISTWEDKGIDTEEARLQAYGQNDHVRLFGSDIFQILSTHGLISAVSQHNNILSNTNHKKIGVNPNEPFFLFKKPEID